MKRENCKSHAAKFFQAMRERTVSEPTAWQMTADSLLRAARQICQLVVSDHSQPQASVGTPVQPNLVPVYMMFMGLAIENLAKAIFVAREHYFGQENSKPESLGHKLLDLFDRIQFEVNEAEYFLVERLEIFVVWAGRYPVPKSAKDMLPRVVPPGGHSVRTYLSIGEIQHIEDLVARLEIALEQAKSEKRNGAKAG
jgi:hypothetical protein